MSNLIDRQQAIDVIDKEQKEIDVSDVSAMYAYSKCKTIIKQLPSALGTNLAEVGRDCISRQAAIDALGGNEPVGDPSKMDDDDVVKMWERIRIINIINKLPSAQPDIVRCRDCRYYNHEEKECLDLLGYGRRWEEDDFCSYAER